MSVFLSLTLMKGNKTVAKQLSTQVMLKKILRVAEILSKVPVQSDPTRKANDEQTKKLS